MWLKNFIFCFLLVLLFPFCSGSCKQESDALTKASADKKTDSIPSNKPPVAPDTSSAATEKGDNMVTITVSFAEAANDADATIPLLKYNKKKCIAFEFDDGALVAEDKFLSTSYTDGCGNTIPYTAGIAVNGRHGWDNRELGVTDGILYTKMRDMINKGWDIMNHGYYHNFGDNEDKYTFGPDAVKNITELDQLIGQKVSYKMNTMVVPTNYKGYQIAAKEYGYVGGTSQNTFDGLPLWNTDNRPHDVSQMKAAAYQVNEREFAWMGWVERGANGDWIWTFIDGMTNATGTREAEIGTHDMNATEQAIFRRWMQEIKDRNGDNLMMTSLREFLEYSMLRNYVVKTESISGNTLKITLDYSSVPNKNISWKDLSLIIGGKASITSVSTDNSTFKVNYNPNSRLINIKYRKTTWG